jgi:metal-responsive CopG/Arc/MetJ family transcriptional regulator
MATHQLVVRLPPDLARDLKRHAGNTRRSRSVVVREALRTYLRSASGERRPPSERVAHLLGSLDSATPDLTENSRRYLLESLRRGR